MNEIVTSQIEPDGAVSVKSDVGDARSFTDNHMDAYVFFGGGPPTCDMLSTVPVPTQFVSGILLPNQRIEQVLNSVAEGVA